MHLKPLRYIFIVLGCCLLAYAGTKFYYWVNDGFLVSNIASTSIANPRWNVRPLSTHEKQKIEKILEQPYFYLGKGCQSYVFVSQDGNYVIKFLKHQHFRPQKWINLFTVIPAIEQYQLAKKKEKQDKLNKVLNSWKLSFDSLQKETGVVYAHINKSSDWNQTIAIRDKMGLTHSLQIDDFEFLLQRKATMLCRHLDALMTQGKDREAEILIDRLMAMLLAEYTSGFADNDHALMQNTGVLEGWPIHIDVGQLIRNPIVQDPQVLKQEIYDKTYLFSVWLQKHYPELALHLRTRLVALLDFSYYFLAPYKHKGDVGKIPHFESLQETR